MADQFLYFGYGSNLLTARLQGRTPSARMVATGYVAKRKLTFAKTSKDGSGKCDAELTGNAADRVEGVVFTIDLKEKPALNKAEGLCYGYEEAALDVVTPEGVRTALAYVASAGATDPARVPYHWYKALVLAGAIEQKLSAALIEHLRAVRSQRDPVRDRETKRDAERALQNADGAVQAWYREQAE